MKIAVMQPYFFPYIGYFQLMNEADVFVILDDVTFINKGWINRNHILLNGKRALFTIPLVNASQNRLIRDIEISYEQDWTTKLLKKLTAAYSKAPNYEIIYDDLARLLSAKKKYIADLIYAGFDMVKKNFDRQPEFMMASEAFGDVKLKGEERIIEICKRLHAKQYINPIGGEKLYSKEKFLNEGIQLSFLKTDDAVYRQYGNEFIGSLSMIDVLMFNTVPEVKVLLKKITLV